MTQGDGASYPAVHPFVHLQRSGAVPSSPQAYQPRRAALPSASAPLRPTLPASAKPSAAPKAAPTEDLRSMRIKGIVLFFGFWMVVTAMFLMLFLGRL
jgi:hypothetical protein